VHIFHNRIINFQTYTINYLCTCANVCCKLFKQIFAPSVGERYWKKIGLSQYSIQQQI